MGGNNYGKVNTTHKSTGINVLSNLHLQATNANQTQQQRKNNSVIWKKMGNTK